MTTTRALFRSCLVAFVGPVGLAVLVACADPLAGPVDVEAVVRNVDTNEYGLEVVTLTTPTDLFKAEAAGFYALRDFHFDKAARGEAVDVGAYPDIDDYIAANRQRSGGLPPPMALHQEGDYWVAGDFDTLMLVSAFVAIERTLTFFDEIGDESGATADRLVVAQFGQVTGLGLPEVSADNASYLALADAMFLYPEWLLGKLGNQLPLASNEGVIAHELGHRMFFFNVHHEVARLTWRSVTADPPGTADERRLAGLNEGLADVFAVGLTGDPDFGGISGLGEDRNLDLDAARSLTYERVTAGEASCSGGARVSDPSFAIYCLGTLVASTLWESSGRDAATFRLEVLPALVRAMRRMGETVELAFTAEGDLVFDVDLLLEPLASELGPGATRDRLCAEVAGRFSTLVAEGRVPSCP